MPSMYPLGPGGTIPDALNRKENHDRLEKSLRAAIDESAAAGVPNVITFSGNRRGMDDRGGRGQLRRVPQQQSKRMPRTKASPSAWST